jgi:hypothetical protein
MPGVPGQRPTPDPTSGCSPGCCLPAAVAADCRARCPGPASLGAASSTMSAVPTSRPWTKLKLDSPVTCIEPAGRRAGANRRGQGHRPQLRSITQHPLRGGWDSTQHDLAVDAGNDIRTWPPAPLWCTLHHPRLRLRQSPRHLRARGARELGAATAHLR